MGWRSYALMGAASFAATGIIDKHLLGGYFKDSYSYLAVLILFQQVFNLGIVAWQGLEFQYPWTLMAVLAGGLQVLLWVAYLKALQVEEVSRVTSLVFVYPLFVYLGSAAVLGEVLPPRGYAGGLLLVAAAVLVSYRPSCGGRGGFSSAWRYLMVFWVAVAGYSVAAKYLLGYMDEWQLVLWSSAGNLAVVLPLLLRGDVRSEVAAFLGMGRGPTFAVFLEEIFDLGGRAFMIFAYALGPVSLVTSVNALQPLMVLAAVVVLSLRWPWVLEEEMEGLALAAKLVSVVMVAAGIWLIS